MTYDPAEATTGEAEAFAAGQRSAAEWQPIETAPREGGVMLIARYPTGYGWSDPYFGWFVPYNQLSGGSDWARWPHKFPPTHWASLPPPPQTRAGGRETPSALPQHPAPPSTPPAAGKSGNAPACTVGLSCRLPYLCGRLGECCATVPLDACEWCAGRGKVWTQGGAGTEQCRHCAGTGKDSRP